MRDLSKPISLRFDGGTNGFSIIGILLIFIVLTFLLTSCATKKQLCPSENMVYYIFTPFGLMPVMIQKDFFNEKNKDGGWMTEEAFNKMMEEQEESFDIPGQDIGANLESYKKSVDRLFGTLRDVTD